MTTPHERARYWAIRQRLWGAIFWALVLLICLIGLLIRHRAGGVS